MYKVVVVDDETASLEYIKNIIKKKCVDFEVVDIALNGEEALEKISKYLPDVVISDIKMPILDGVGLAEKVHNQYPDIYFLIVSGYGDFEYAKKAIKFDVCDYLLKPLKPSELNNSLKIIANKIKNDYYMERKKIIGEMCSNFKIVEENKLEKYFSKGEYYCGIIRKNGLPSRFNRSTDIEIFSLEEEQIHIYGRDEMELLYLCPTMLLSNQSFSKFMQKRFNREILENNYVTCIYKEEKFLLKDFPSIAKAIYGNLYNNVTVGKNKILTLKSENKKNEILVQKENELIELINFLIKNNEIKNLSKKIKRLFDIWIKNDLSQIAVERKLFSIFHKIKNNSKNPKEWENYEYELSDLFFYSTSMEEILENVIEKIDMHLPKGEEKEGNNEELYYTILSFLENNMEKNISLTTVCRQFGISQTSLSKWFREYGNSSFNRYLTTIRIEKAKQIILTNPEIYIKDVSKLVGYNDQFYFSRIFRTIEGISPSEFIFANFGEDR